MISIYSIANHLLQHKEEMPEGVKQHVPHYCILTLGLLNYATHFEEPNSNDRKKIEYCSGS